MKVAAVILAAGAGVRLGGRNKAALPLAGGTFLAAVVATARASGVADLVVVAGPPHGLETLALAAALHARVVWNAAPERGMSSSIVAGLDAAAELDAILVWPVDHARVSPVTATAVVAAATREGIVVPCHQGRGGHPTSFGADLWPELRLCHSARDVVSAHPSRITRLAVEDPGVLRDVDHPSDLVVEVDG